MACKRDQLEILKEPRLPLLQVYDEFLQDVLAKDRISEPPNLAF